MEKRHGTGPSQTARPPARAQRIGSAVATDLGKSKGYPDLSKIGCRFVGAGPCADPSADTVHLLYRSSDPDSHRTMSVFVQRQKGQFELQPNKLYVVSGPRSPFPMYAWRSDRVVYFLIADDDTTVRETRQEVALAPRS